MTTHEQVYFSTIDGGETLVDRGMFDILTYLRELGCETQFSCEDEGREIGTAYVVFAKTKDAKRLERMMRKAQNSMHYSLPSRITAGWFVRESSREFSLSWFKNRKDGQTMARIMWCSHIIRGCHWIERQYTNKYGYRTTWRWPIEESNFMFSLLQEMETKR